jgi:hypothetical protein
MSTKEWSVSIDAEGPAGGSVSEDGLETFLAEIASTGGVVVGAGNRYGARMNVVGSAKQAIEAAIRTFRKASSEAELPNWPIVRVEASTIDELDRELARPLFPDLVGVTEVAALLGVSKQRVSQLVRASNPKFPQPMFELAATPVWSRWQIDHFAESWDREPGRPRAMPLGVLPGVDLDKALSLAGELEDEEILRKRSRS